MPRRHRPRSTRPRKPTARVDLLQIERWLTEHGQRFSYAQQGGRPQKGSTGLVPALMRATGISERSARRALGQVRLRRQRQVDAAARAASLGPVERSWLTSLAEMYGVGKTLPLAASITLPKKQRRPKSAPQQAVTADQQAHIPPSPAAISAAAAAWLLHSAPDDLDTVVIDWARHAAAIPAAEVARLLAPRIPPARAPTGLENVGLRTVASPPDTTRARVWNPTNDLLEAMDAFRAATTPTAAVQRALDELARAIGS